MLELHLAIRNKKQSPLDLILITSWKVVALFALFLFLVLYVIFPALNNPVISSVIAPLKPFSLIVIGVLMLISIIKLSFQVYLGKKAKKYSQNNLEQNAESPFSKTTLSEFLQRPTNWSLIMLQEIEWKRFEDLSMAYYLEKGVLAKATSLGVDGGINIKLYQDGAENPTSLVQCKAWSAKQVGIKEIRAFLGVLTHEKIAKGFFMISGEFTNDAKEIAKANKINLINGEMFLFMIMRLPEVSQNKLFELAIAGDYKTPSCSVCGIKMVNRRGKRGVFWGCVNYPKCRQKIAI